MALLDAVVYPQPQGHFGYGHRDASYRLSWSSDATGFGEWDPFLLASLVQNAEELGEEVGAKKASLEQDAAPSTAEPPPPVTTTKRKRRRPKVVKNEEEIERQRMTHIAVERNRRRQMNEYLAVLRSLMPSSYAQRGDQASIVGGAINYVRELEQLLQSLEVQRSLKEHNPNLSNPFASFFRFPQYSATSASHCQGGAGNHTNKEEGPIGAPSHRRRSPPTSKRAWWRDTPASRFRRRGGLGSCCDWQTVSSSSGSRHCISTLARPALRS